MLIRSLKYLIAAVVLIYSGCLKNPAGPPGSFQMNSSAEMLTYLEQQGDYINSGAAPSLVEAEEVFSNLGSYLIIDVRPSDQFTGGHIVGAVNIQNNNLLNYFLTNRISDYPKVVIVSQTGQAASYYACLLILSGYGNVYAMNFGMSAWNADLSGLWLQHTKNFSHVNLFDNETPLYNNLSSLPGLSFRPSSKSIEDKLKERIEILLNEGFRDNPEDAGKSYNASVTADDIFDAENGFSRFYIVCYGIPDLYYTATIMAGDPLAGFGHPPDAVLFSPNAGFRSTEMLQSLPHDKVILIYSGSGHLSAFAAAYLRVFGYNVKSLLFGANDLIYSRMIWRSTLEKDAFTSSKIMNYPYSTGN